MASGSNHTARERVIVVGAGIVGCVAAMYLVRRGFRVTVYERQDEGRRDALVRRPSLSLSLCTRGIRSLERIGVMDRLRDLLAPAFGRLIHTAGGAVYQAYSVFGDAIHCVDRHELGLALQAAAVERGVDLVFGRRCVGLDARSGRLTVADRAGTRSWDQARAIIAADGSSSTVRQCLQQEGWWQFTQARGDDGYKEFRVSAAAAAGLRPQVLHGWPRTRVIVGAFPTPDGGFSGTFHAPLTGPDSFHAMSEAAVAALFRETCPELAHAATDVAAYLGTQRPNALSTVSGGPWTAAGRVLLIGDAAHAMLPYYGQGANAGLEDCRILDELIDRHGTDWQRLFHSFESTRRPDVDAMAGLCAEHLAVLRDQVSQPDFHAQWEIEQRLHRLIPDAFAPLYSMIAFSSLPYAEARRRARLQEPVVQELLRDPLVARRLDDAEASVALGRDVRARLSGLAAPARAALTAAATGRGARPLHASGSP